MFRPIYFYAIFLLVITVEAHAVNKITVSIGVLAFRGESVALERWSATADYLTEQGVDGSRITVKGMGETAPVADNATRDGRAMNRRVDLRTN